MVLYWGARSLRDLYLPDLPGEWQAEHRELHVHPGAVRAAPEDAWPGRTGFVHAAVMRRLPGPVGLPGLRVRRAGDDRRGAPRLHRSSAGCRAEEFFADSFTYAAEAEARPS